MCREYATRGENHNTIRQSRIDCSENVRFSKEDSLRIRKATNPNPFWIFNGKKIAKKSI